VRAVHGGLRSCVRACRLRGVGTQLGETSKGECTFTPSIALFLLAGTSTHLCVTDAGCDSGDAPVE
jgi:hypothetical protein